MGTNSDVSNVKVPFMHHKGSSRSAARQFDVFFHLKKFANSLLKVRIKHGVLVLKEVTQWGFSCSVSPHNPVMVGDLTCVSLPLGIFILCI